MITIYQANSSIDAKLIQDQLGFADIPSHIMGDLLQGGVGELQPQGLVKVMVDEEDFEKAREVVERWEGEIVVNTDNNSNSTIKSKTIKPRIFAIILFLIFLFTYLYLSNSSFFPDFPSCIL